MVPEEAVPDPVADAVWNIIELFRRWVVGVEAGVLVMVAGGDEAAVMVVEEADPYVDAVIPVFWGVGELVCTIGEEVNTVTVVGRLDSFHIVCLMAFNVHTAFCSSLLVSAVFFISLSNLIRLPSACQTCMAAKDRLSRH